VKCNEICMLRASEVIARTKLSRSTIWRLERVGRFPARRQISVGRVAWVESEINDWLGGRVAIAPHADFSS
jgi:prophage regulatory protein